jgi:hypothetical protein
MGFAAGPDFMEQEGARAFRGSMQVVGQAAVFFACGAYQGAQFGFQEQFLAFPRAQLDDESHGVFRELSALGFAGFAGTSWFFLCFALRHSGRDSTPTWAENPNLQKWRFSSESVRCCRSQLFLSQLATGVEVIEIQDGVEHERVCAAGFAAIHRIDGKEHDVTVAGGHVHYGGMLGDFVAAFD